MKPRVLIIDDEAAIRRALERMLVPGYAVTCANSATEAVHLVAGGARFEAVLCDYAMPDMNGEQLFAAIVALDPRLEHRFILMTGMLKGAVKMRVLEKPFDHDDLLAIVADVVAAGGS